MNIGGGGVDAEIDAEGRAGFEGVFEFRFQLGFGNDFGDAFFEVGELLFDGVESCWRHFRLLVAAASRLLHCNGAGGYWESVRRGSPFGAERFGPKRALQGEFHRPLVSLGYQYAAASDFVTAFEDDSNGFGINSVFFLQNSGGQRVFGVVVCDGNDGLQDDGSGVEIFVDKMDGAAGEFDAIFEGLALRLEAGERREERRVNVEDATGEGGDEIRGEKAHVAGEADEIDFMLVEDGDDLAVVGFALKAFGGDGASGDASGFGAVEAGSAFAIADDDGDFGVGNAVCGNAVR